jgi:hypothetical protein
LIRVNGKQRTALRVLVAVLSLYSFATAQFETRVTISSPLASWIAVGDFNRDGKIDLAVPNPNSTQIAILLGKGDGTFRTPVEYTVGSAPVTVVVADFNQDGKLDLAVANGASNNISVLLGNGDGTFQPAMNFSVFESPSFVGVGDFNGDGKPDLVALEQPGFGDCPCTSVLLGNGDGTFQPALEAPIPFPAWAAIAVGDFNGDGKLDLAVAGQFGFSSEVGILLGNGDGTFQQGASYSVGTDPLAVVAADLNGDGKLDLVTANSQGVGVSVLLGNGDGTFQAAVNYPVSGFPYSITAADLNGDRKPDLAVANLLTLTGDLKAPISVLFGNGDGTFQPESTYPVGKEPRFVAVGDFNGDHKADLAVADFLSEDVTILLNTGVVSFSPTSPVAFPTQLVGTTSSPHSVTLTNTGTTALSISSITLQGSQFRLSSGNTTCGGSVPPGGSCKISALFRPQSKDGKSGTVTIVDSASSKPQVVELSGTGTVVQISPKKLSFPDTKVGTKSAPLSVTLKNTGSTALNFTGIQLYGSNFSQTNTCGTQIAAGATCTISVTFTPVRTGLHTGTMSISDDGGGSPQSVTLSGTGT